jgi:transposase
MIKFVLSRRESRPDASEKIMKKEVSMRKEYDFSKGERGKFYAKVDTKNPIIEADDETLDEVFEEELTFLESNLARIKNLKARLVELDEPSREKISQRISNASEILDKIALSE